MENLRIAMVAACPFPTSQGTQVFIGQLAEALRLRGHQVHLVTYHFGDKNLPVSAPIHRTPRLPFSGKLTSGPSLRKPIFDMLLAGKLDQVVRHRRVHLIHAHNYEGALAGLAIRGLRKVPVVFHTHNTMAHELPAYSRSRCGRRMAGWLGRLLDEQVPRRADACVAVTPDIVTYLQQLGAAPERIWAIPPAIQADQFETGRPISPGERKGPWRLLYAGNLDNYQNLKLLLNSLKELTAGGHQCLLEVVTNSPSIHFEKQARDMGLGEQVHFTHTTSFRIVRELLARCDLTLCPRVSPYGFPIKLLNYLAAGKAVVICKGSAHGIRHGVNGWVVKDDDAGEFAAGITTLMRNDELRTRLCQNALTTIREDFSWGRWAPRYEEVYQRTLERWRRAR